MNKTYTKTMKRAHRKARRREPTLAEFKRTLRNAIADYISSEGCSCCRTEPAHAQHAERIAQLIGVPKFADGSGYAFLDFKTKR